MEFVNWLLRSYVDEDVVFSQLNAFNDVAQEGDKTETAFLGRVRDPN